MVKLESFAVDHWISTRVGNAPHQLAQTNSLAMSIRELEQVPGDDATTDVLESFRDRQLHYGTQYNGLKDLRRKIAALYSTEMQYDNILMTPGASLANFIVFYALIGPGDHLVVPFPTYPQLYSVPVSLGAEISYWYADAKDEWKFDVADLEPLIKPNTKMIVVNNPINPLGTTVPESTLRSIIDVARKHSIIVFGDEIYRPIFYPSSNIEEAIPSSIVNLGYDKTIATCSLSKSYSLAGLRLGWVATPSTAIMDVCINARCYCLITNSQLDEHVANFALDAKRATAIVKKNIDRTKQNRAIVQAFIDEHAEICSWVAPTGGPMGFILFRREGRPVDDVELCKKLHEDHGVLLVPASLGFGKEFLGYVRIGLGMEEVQLRNGLGVVSTYLKNDFGK